MKLFDMHCDTLYECYETGEALRKNDLAIDRDKCAGYTHYAQVFALFCGAHAPDYAVQGRTRRSLMHLKPELRMDAMLDTARNELEKNSDWLMQCRTAQDFADAAAQGKAAAWLSIEGADLIQTENGLQKAFDAGVRILTITWNYKNWFGTPAKLDQSAGLTDMGKQLVKDMNRMGIVPDVSHLSDGGFWDVAEISEKPFIASHSNSRSVCSHFRNLTDAQFDAVVQAGGRVGINIYGAFVKEGGVCTPDDVLRHIEHFCARGGAKHLALGADLDGCDVLPEGIHTVADMELIAEAMLRRNYSEEIVNGLFYENMSCFIRENF